MNSKLWIRKALSTCLIVALVATYSMVAMANSKKIAGELTVTGNSETPFVTVNGQQAASGRSIFSSSIVSTPENAGAVINLGKIGEIELAPQTVLSLSFDENGISGDLEAGRLTVLGTQSGVNITTLNGKTSLLTAGESILASGKAQDDDDDDDGGGAWIWFGVALAGAAGIIIYTATRNDNRAAFGGGSVNISPTR